MTKTATLPRGRKRAKKARKLGVPLARVRQIALTLPGVEEGLSYGTPAFRVKGKLLARLKEDGGTLVVGIEFDEREALMAAHPATFFITDHYRGYPWILVRLANVDRDDLRRMLEAAWRKHAPRRLLAGS